MKQLIIATLPGAATTVAALTAGQGGFLVDINNPNNVAISLDAVEKDRKIQIVHKTKSGKVQVSDVFSMDEIAEAIYVAYNAGTKQKWVVTPVLPAVQVKGMEFIVKIIDTTPGNLSVDQKSFSVFHTGTDFTATTLGNAFRALINAAGLKVVASGTTTLILEASTPDNHFSVAVDGDMELSTVSNTVKNIPSSGTTEKMKALEADCESYAQGITNKTMYPVVRPVTEVADGNYNRHVFTIMSKYANKDGMVPVRAHRKTLHIASTAANNPLGKVLFDAI